MTPTTDEPTARDRFVSDAMKRAYLLSILRDPVVQEALDIAEDMLRPRCGTPADANQPLSIARFHQSAGANEFVKNLRELTREPKDVVKLSVKRLAKSADDLPTT